MLVPTRPARGRPSALGRSGVRQRQPIAIGFVIKQAPASGMALTMAQKHRNIISKTARARQKLSRHLAWRGDEMWRECGQCVSIVASASA